MEIHFFPTFIGVLTSPYVICTAVFLVLYVSFASYVASYKKKPPKPAKKKKAAPPPPPPKPSDDESDETSEG